MSDLPDTVDVAIIGSGIGGSTIAYGLAGSGARIAILERGFHLGAHPAARDARAIPIDSSHSALAARTGLHARFR
jgi:flavin-dependent dehydrogenase